MFKCIHRRHKGEHGSSAVEYGLLVALIAAVITVAVWAIGVTVKDTLFNQSSQTITTAHA